MTLGEKLQDLRKERHLSQEHLSEEISVSRQTISKWERDLAVPDTDHLVTLSKYFEVPLEFLLSVDCNDRDDFVGFHKEETFEAEKKKVSLVLRKKYFFFGMAFVMLSICSTYVFQYFDMEINGSCYTNAFHYLWEFPLVLFLLIGILFLVVGVINLKK